MEDIFSYLPDDGFKVALYIRYVQFTVIKSNKCAQYTTQYNS